MFVVISDLAQGGLQNEDGVTLNELGELYYSVKQKELSEATAAFNYAELNLALDRLYGMKETHGIESFDNLSMQTGYNPDLKSTDPSSWMKLCIRPSRCIWTTGTAIFCWHLLSAAKDS